MLFTGTIKHINHQLNSIPCTGVVVAISTYISCPPDPLTCGDRDLDVDISEIETKSHVRVPSLQNLTQGQKAVGHPCCLPAVMTRHTSITLDRPPLDEQHAPLTLLRYTNDV